MQLVGEDDGLAERDRFPNNFDSAIRSEQLTNAAAHDLRIVGEKQLDGRTFLG